MQADRPERAAYAERSAQASAALRALPAGAPPALAKRTSNLFRDREPRGAGAAPLDLGAFDHVLEVNVADGWVDTEGLVTYEALADATLAHGHMPCVVPQLKTITAGGAVVGVGIEATSFRHGLVHDTLLEADVLLAGGEVLTCAPRQDAHRELFLALPNSYGTLGYALRLRLRTQPVARFVRVGHRPFADAPSFFAALVDACEDPTADFVDGVVFDRHEFVLNVAHFVDEAGATSDYTYLDPYWRSLRTKAVDYLGTRDYLWRWDTDWFWCSKNVGADRPWVRRLLGRERLNSRTYQKIMRFNARWGLTRRLARLRGVHTESVIQDVDVPMAEAVAFLEFLFAEIGVLPIWICPIRAADPALPFTLYPLAPGTRYVNFGFWDVLESREPLPAGHFNRLVERRVAEAGGIKSLYSDSYFTADEFAAAYPMDRYAALKRRYDPQGRFLGLYEKCVLRA